MLRRSVARFAVVAAGFLLGCTIPPDAGGKGDAKIRLVIPRLRDVRFAAVNERDPLEPTELRAIITVGGTTIFDQRFSTDDPSVTEGADGSDIQATVVLRFKYPASAQRDVFTFQLNAFSKDGIQVMTAGPTTFHLNDDGSGASIEPPLTYVGPGKDVTSVVLAPRSLTIAAGSSAPVTCTGNPGGVTLFPFEVRSDNPGIADVDQTETGGVVFGTTPGTTTIRCTLAFARTVQDAIPVTVTAAPAQGITLVGGAGQSAPPGVTLPVPITVRVRGAGGVLLPSANVAFTPSAGSGTAAPTTRATASDGTASTTWTLGTSVGTQTMVVSVANPPMSLIVTATAVAAGSGSLVGVVSNSLTGAPIPNASVQLRSGSGVTTGAAAFSATSTSTGSYGISNIPPGVYTVLATAPGYDPYSVDATIATGTQTQRSLGLVPSGTAGIIIRLFWNHDPGDLDAHLYTPTGSHIYFGNKGDCASVCLELDDTDGDGPETLQINQLVSGSQPYTFKVHNFDASAGETSIQLRNSGAYVTISGPGITTRTFTVPDAAGVTWTVFTMTGPATSPVITAVNTMSDVPPSFAGLRADSLPQKPPRK
ncbi:MAG TPA: carboxypeptidase regulatory-like domain-containing protein [Gemmatimonadaceae bacterium]|nr:carboxypeptidase regulatory-like domain-containing protein [Gemmatimonadaceae bacterium]